MGRVDNRFTLLNESEHQALGAGCGDQPLIGRNLKLLTYL